MFNKKISKETYTSFIKENKEMLYRIAFGYLRDEVKSLDAVDEAVYLGYVHIKDLREPKYLKTWLVRILINECLKIIRNNKRELIMEVLPEDSESLGEDLIHLQIAIASLSEDLRKVIVLRYFGGLTIWETGETLGIPDGTVSTRSRKALKILRVELSDEEGVSYDG